MTISKVPFGSIDGVDVDLYTLENGNGMTVKIMNYGGIVTSIVVPDKNGNRSDIVCGFDTLDGYFSEAYKGNSPYFGCIVGRYAGRIKDGTFTLDGKAYPLAQNNAPHHLHGGIVGFDKVIWDAQTEQEANACVLRLSRVSPDGEEGYPGTLKVAVEYRLTQDNELRIRYLAETDKATPLALTNHTYFNLNSFTDTILDHQAQIQSDRYLDTDESGAHVADTQMVAGTVCDFTSPKRIGDAFEELEYGFEHFYCFTKAPGICENVAVFTDAKSGRTLEIDTTEPGMLFYTGRYTSDDLAREDGTAFGQFKAFCCETARHPNGPNIAGSPNTVLKPCQKHDETTVFRFKW